jgi:hypothetical protein
MKDKIIYSISAIFLFFLFLILIHNVFGATTTYDFNNASTIFTGGDDFDQDSYPPDNTLPPDSLGDFSVTDINRMKTSDNQYATSGVPDDAEGYAIFNSSVGDGVISSLNWTWEGKFDDSDGDDTLHFFAWNNTGSSWFECLANITDTPSDVTKSCYISSGVADFYDASKRSYFMIWGTDPDEVGNTFGSQISTDYVNLKINSIIATLDSPANNTYSKTALNNFVCTGSDSSLQTMNLTIWNSTNSLVFQNTTNISGSTNTTNMSMSITPDGVYKWNCLLITSGSVQTTATNNNTITIDTLKPQISISYPSNNSNFSTTSLAINYTVSDLYLSSCKWTKNAGTTNTSLTCGTNITGQTWTEGLNNITIYANDTAGNENSSSVRFRVDTTAPSINIVLPSASQEFSSNTSIPLNYTVSDSGVGLSSCWFNLDNGANTTITNCLNTTFNSSDGSHTIHFFSNDTLNNLASTTRSYTISLDAPAINLDSPTNGTYWNNGTSFYLNYTATDSNGISFCQIWHNINGSFALNQTNTGITSGQQNFTSYNIDDGNYLWNIFCQDTTGQGRFSTTNKTFIIDETDPVVNITSITTTAGSQTISFNHTETDTNLLSCKYSVYNASSMTIDGLNNNISVSCNVGGSSATVTSYGTYTLRIYAVDLAGNQDFEDLNFTTSASSGTTIIGGGGAPTVVTIQVGASLSQNFSITTTSLGNKLDLVLAKNSVKSRSKTFIVSNKGKDEFIVNLKCDTTDLNESEQNPNNVDICDYVYFDKETLAVSPNEDSPSEGKVYVIVPENATFGDQYSFNVLAERSSTDNSSLTYSKLSVTSRVPVWGLVFKYSFIPFQAKEKENKASYPVVTIALFLAFLIMGIVIQLLKKSFLVAGFLLGVAGFVITFSVSLAFL